VSTPVLVCFPHAGATSAVYRHWSPLTGGFDVVHLDRPGRGRGPTSVGPSAALPEAVAASAAYLISRLKGQRTWIAFGHSFGAAMAAAVVTEVTTRGVPAPALTVLSCGPAPRHQDPRNPAADLDDDQLNEHLLGLGETGRSTLEGPLGTIIRRHFRQDQALRAQLAQGAVGLRLSGPVLTVAARSDRFVPAGHVRAWKDYSTGTTAHVDVDGGHFAVVRDPAPVLDLARSALSGVAA
jgi:surfactin synthase thioesterase subunit